MKTEEIADVVIPVVVGEDGALRHDALLVVDEDEDIVSLLYPTPDEGEPDPFAGEEGVLLLRSLGQMYPRSPFVMMARCGHSAPDGSDEESLPTIHVHYMHRDGTASASIFRLHEDEEIEVLQGVAVGPNPLWHFFRGTYVA